MRNWKGVYFFLSGFADKEMPNSGSRPTLCATALGETEEGKGQDCKDMGCSSDVPVPGSFSREVR